MHAPPFLHGLPLQGFFSHSSPLKPGLQAQTGSPSLMLHVPSFWQGFGEQASTLFSQVAPLSQCKVAWQSSRKQSCLLTQPTASQEVLASAPASGSSTFPEWSTQLETKHVNTTAMATDTMNDFFIAACLPPSVITEQCCRLSVESCSPDAINSSV
jgi:hypothetical protein